MTWQTRRLSGSLIGPHIDRGWSVDHWSSKFYVVLAGNAETVNRCEDEAVVMLPGSIWQFENRVMHSVENNGNSERISLIVTLRTEA
jgi:mannose-6-phosphate isomerase-like protein (cupin superfamily)